MDSQLEIQVVLQNQDWAFSQASVFFFPGQSSKLGSLAVVCCFLSFSPPLTSVLAYTSFHTPLCPPLRSSFFGLAEFSCMSLSGGLFAVSALVSASVSLSSPNSARAISSSACSNFNFSVSAASRASSWRSASRTPPRAKSRKGRVSLESGSTGEVRC